MGRVDEAMRRAEEQARAAAAGALSHPPAPAAARAPDDLVLRELPAEAGEADRRIRPGAPVPQPTTPRPSLADTSKAAFQSVRDRIGAALAMKVVVDPAMKPRSREQYRRLAAGLHQAQGTNGLKVVMLTSALPGEGKTLTSSNLALTLSESFRQRVLLIDADLRRPSVHVVFNVDWSSGLAEGLAAAEDQPLAIHHVSPYLSILPAGRPTSDPGTLTSTRMRRVIDEARAAFDWVIIDTPPIGLLADANLLASMVDGVLVVVKAADTPYILAQRAVDAIGREKILGVVLNRAAAGDTTTGYGYERYYRPTTEIAPPG